MSYPSSVSGPFRELQRGKITPDEYARRTLREAEKLVRDSERSQRAAEKSRRQQKR